MGLPFTRYYTAGSNEIVGGSVLVAVQDLAARFFRRRARQAQRLHVAPIQLGSIASFNPLASAWVAGGTGGTELWAESTAGSQRHRLPLHFRVGDKLLGMQANYWKAVSNYSVTLLRREMDTNTVGGTPASDQIVFTLTLDGAATTWLTKSMTGAHPVADGFMYWLEVLSAASGDRVSGLIVDFSHPGS